MTDDKQPRQTEPPGPRHIADEPLSDPDAADAGVQPPTTETGLSVEEQVRKEWDPNKNGGLPLPLSDAGSGAEYMSGHDGGR